MLTTKHVPNPRPAERHQSSPAVEKGTNRVYQSMHKQEATRSKSLTLYNSFDVVSA